MRIAITQGDAAGVGPELVLRAHERGLFDAGAVVIGDYSVLQRCKEQIGSSTVLRRVSSEDFVETLNREDGSADRQTFSASGTLIVCDLGLLDGHEVVVGKLSAATGGAAARYVEYATRLALEGTIDGFVTCPINKEATRLALPDFTGHTELIAELCGAAEISMMLASDKLIVTHVSTHVSLIEAIRRVTSDRVASVIRLTHQALSRFVPNPRLAVCGVNPHAGEGGAFGQEDITQIAPAVATARAEGIAVFGPEPADTVFHRAVGGEFDGVVCMYHDQGHIPMKTLDFHGGVNITLGLPIVRTSVDHGTAFDIAWQGVASTVSLHQAYLYATRLIEEPHQGDGE